MGEGNKALPWSGIRDAKPKRGEETAVGGDRAPSDLVFVTSRGRKIRGGERAQLLSRFFFLFFFFFYIMYSLLRYKTLHAALAMA